MAGIVNAYFYALAFLIACISGIAYAQPDEAEAHFSVGGNVIGLPVGDTVTIQNNGLESLVLSKNGTFSFQHKFKKHDSYAVLVTNSSDGLVCEENNSIGKINDNNIDAIFIVCTDKLATQYVKPMSRPHSGHTSTLLLNGKLLVVEGSDYTEYYDSDIDQWRSISINNKYGGGHTATLLNDGSLLVTGGYFSGSAHQEYTSRFDPVQEKWQASGKMDSARSGHTATLLDDGTVIVIGGRGEGTVDHFERFDPNYRHFNEFGTPLSWKTADSISFFRQNHTATLLNNGKILIVGGSKHGSGALASAEIYDPENNVISSAGSMKVGRTFHTATLLKNGKVLIVGGQNNMVVGNISSAEIYDPETNSWSSAGSLQLARAKHTATLMPDGKVLIAGGNNFYSLPVSEIDLLSDKKTYRSVNIRTYGSNRYIEQTRSINEIYDPVTNTWVLAGHLAAARVQHTATLLRNGQVLFAGGLLNREILSSVELYGQPEEAANSNKVSRSNAIEGETILYPSDLMDSADGSLRNNRTGGLVTGLLVVNYPDGTIMSKIPYKDGWRHGELMSWYLNGDINEKCTYNNGKQDGYCVAYFEDGTIKSECNYINGMVDGYCVGYFENGSSKFVRGKAANIKFYASGAMASARVYDNGKKIFDREWSEDGSVMPHEKPGKPTYYYPDLNVKLADYEELHQVNFHVENRLNLKIGNSFPESMSLLTRHLIISKFFTNLCGYGDSFCVYKYPDDVNNFEFFVLFEPTRAKESACKGAWRYYLRADKVSGGKSAAVAKLLISKDGEVLYGKNMQPYEWSDITCPLDN